MSTTLRWAGASLLAVLILAACGSSKSTKGAGTTAAPATTAPATTAAPPTTAAGGSSTSGAAGAGAQTVTVTPNTGLQNNQVVHVVAKGFTPNESLGITQCADKGTQTSDADCNLGGVVPTSADGSGTVTSDFAVIKGPFGSNNIVCSATQKCLVSVTQLTPNPTQEADADISFAS